MDDLNLRAFCFNKSLVINMNGISDLRANVRKLIDAAEFLNSFLLSTPENAQPAVIAVYNALLEVINTLNEELEYEREGMEYISLQYLQEEGVSATLTLETQEA